MSRTYVVTGAASGIGKSTSELLTEQGHRVIGTDLRDAEIVADLSTASGREQLVEEVTRVSGGGVDAVLAVAGLATPNAATVAVNFYGTVATLEGLRPLLLRSPSPRAVAVSSMAALFPPDETLLNALLDGSETEAMARAAELEAGDAQRSSLIYGTAKRALSRWIRRQAPTAEWADASIPLNAVAPGVVYTPMTAYIMSDAAARSQVAAMVPMPLNGFFEPRGVATLLAWLTSEDNAHLCGQIIYIDGGSDAVLRGDTVF
ncbi:SDR family oxidoreductase [Mycetocola miduiensis]|uniref:NAD(P)-dependent dehydrogenase, short-chain alcohol dehydrogenase family n=1 Tax=Mycetocola miduiensis TaxID=995034 RepID=A0A1I4ZWN4_9MICO|nr:SDR family oxidoreductase [Mycetocola miduiensis]SFN54632.1 NAD(P)-dependent dehydrogenase, short-chain alcohol dehydrogenase family [Mycetocola miduiensis]